MISHGYVVKEYNDPIVDIVEAAMIQASELLEPGAFLVDMVPLCKSPFSRRLAVLTVFTSLPWAGMCRTVRYVPEWFPGAGWKAKAKRFANTLTDMANVPHQFVKDQMVSRCSRWKYCVLSVTFLHLSFPPTSANSGVRRIERSQRASAT